jgi:hypothetical protein
MLREPLMNRASLCRKRKAGRSAAPSGLFVDGRI